MAKGQPAAVRVAIYTRVSTEEQDSINQLAQLHSWANWHGHEIVRTYTDTASGARRRERLDELLEDARNHKFDIVAVWALDRLTRQGTLQTLLYLQRFMALGVQFYSHQEAWLEPSMPFYDTVVSIMADVARWERERLSERTKAGLARVRAQGKHVGRPKGSKDSKQRSRRGYFQRYAQ